MNELKPEDVMRALECFANGKRCEGEQCAYFKLRVGFCGSDLAKDALALLREKDAEIERLKKANQNFAELENGYIVTGYKNIRAEAITEFALRLKSCEFYEVADQYDGMQYVDFCDWVDQIANEMKG